MKKTIYLHIGMAKTASSTLQLFFYSNRKSFEQNDVFFPVINATYGADPTRLGGNARDLYNALSQLGQEKAKNVWEKDYLTQINNTPCSKILLSDELFSFADISFFDKIDLSKFDIKIIVYIRHAVEYLASAWSQSCQSSFYKNFLGNLSLEEFVRRDCDYSKTILSYAQRFGKENIILRPFEKGQLVNNNIYDDVLSCLGIQETSSFERTESQNPSLNRNVSEVAHLINLMDLPLKDHQRLKRELLKNSSPEPKVLNTLSDALIKEITDKHAPAENRLARELLGRETLFLSQYPPIYNTDRPLYDTVSISLKDMEILREALALKSPWKKKIFIKLKTQILNNPLIRKNQFMKSMYYSYKQRIRNK